MGWCVSGGVVQFKLRNVVEFCIICGCVCSCTVQFAAQLSETSFIQLQARYKTTKAMHALREWPPPPHVHSCQAGEALQDDMKVQHIMPFKVRRGIVLVE